MKNLEGKNIYVVGTGAKKIVQLPKAIKEFTEDGARVYTMFSEMGRELCSSNLSDFEIPGNIMVNGYSREGEKLPLEDLVLVAPCTFNTLNKIATGIADTYATTIIASSIGSKRKVVIAPAMNSSMWRHPQIQKSIKELQSWGCKIIYPEILYDKVTMAPIEKIADTVFSSLVKIRYESEQIEVDGTYQRLIEENYHDFRSIGEAMVNLDMTSGTAGCLSKRLGNEYLISSSGSQVGSLSPEELTLVKEVNGRKIIWQGYKPPSSETPLLLEIYSLLSEANAIIHGHCPKMTYNHEMQKYVTPEYVRYGLFGESDKIQDILKKNDGFGILKLHGELCVGNTFGEVFAKLKSKLEEAHK